MKLRAETEGRVCVVSLHLEVARRRSFCFLLVGFDKVTCGEGEVSEKLHHNPGYVVDHANSKPLALL